MQVDICIYIYVYTVHNIQSVSLTICTHAVCITSDTYACQMWYARTYVHECAPGSLGSHVGTTGAVKLLVHCGNAHVLSVWCFKLVQHRMAVDWVGEDGYGLCHFFRVHVQSNGVFEVISLQLAAVSFLHMEQSYREREGGGENKNLRTLAKTDINARYTCIHKTETGRKVPHERILSEWQT